MKIKNRRENQRKNEQEEKEARNDVKTFGFIFIRPMKHNEKQTNRRHFSILKNF